MNENLIGFGAYGAEAPPQLAGRYDLRTWLVVGVVATFVGVIAYQALWENR